MGPVTIFDSTLRDGAQGTGVAFSLEDKLQAVRLLDQVGVQYVEAGNPGSNPKDAEFFQRAASLPLKNAKRRLTHRTFLDKYCRTVREGGEIHFKTDNAPLFAYSLEEFAACGLEVKNVTHDLHKDGIVGIMTGYEEKFHALGTPINRCEIVCKPFVLPPEEKKQTEGQEEA